jgi:hypothetical protein
MARQREWDDDEHAFTTPLMNILKAGTKLRIPPPLSRATEELESALRKACQNFDQSRVERYIEIIKARFVEFYPKDQIFDGWQDHLKDYQDYFILGPTDKSPQTISCVCKYLYQQACIEQLKNFEPATEQNKDQAITDLETFANKRNISGKKSKELPYFYLIPKLHKREGIHWRLLVGSNWDAELKSTCNYTLRIGKEMAKICNAFLVDLREENETKYKDEVSRFFCITATGDFKRTVEKYKKL